MSRRRSRHPKRGARRGSAKAVEATRSASPPTQRIGAIDALRGAAICAMIAYHFAFDLNWFGYIDADFDHDPFLLGARGTIVTAFLLLVGISLLLARRAGVSRVHFWRRIALIVACAVLVSVASYVTFSRTFITFGILHCIALASVLAWPATRFPRMALAVGIAVVAAGNSVSFALFDQPWLNWVGLMTHKPATEDYVPLLPWLGVVLIGIALGAWQGDRQFRELRVTLRAAPGWLTWLGRHSLLVYMVHQPVLTGVLYVLRD